MHILVFNCLLFDLICILLIEYAQRKGNQIIPKTLLCKYMYFFIIIIFTLYKF
jgi:cadmium resistance protein CadD (predicted permease)